MTAHLTDRPNPKNLELLRRATFDSNTVNVPIEQSGGEGYLHSVLVDGRPATEEELEHLGSCTRADLSMAAKLGHADELRIQFEADALKAIQDILEPYSLGGEQETLNQMLSRAPEIIQVEVKRLSDPAFPTGRLDLGPQ